VKAISRSPFPFFDWGEREPLPAMTSGAFVVRKGVPGHRAIARMAWQELFPVAAQVNPKPMQKRSKTPKNGSRKGKNVSPRRRLDSWLCRAHVGRSRW